jgi:hypothetical protein
MSNVKAGDLAIYVCSGHGVPENDGRLFSVLRYLFEESAEAGEPWWEAEAIGGAFDSWGYWNAPGSVGAVADRYLRPITPPPGSVTSDEVRELYQPKTTEHA